MSVSYNVSYSGTTVTVNFQVSGTVDSPIFVYGGSGVQNLSDPNLGYPSNARVSGAYTASFDPGVGLGGSFHFACGAFLTDGTLDQSGDQVGTIPNGTPPPPPPPPTGGGDGDGDDDRGRGDRDHDGDGHGKGKGKDHDKDGRGGDRDRDDDRGGRR